jgi:hypothetical protein
MTKRIRERRRRHEKSTRKMVKQQNDDQKEKLMKKVKDQERRKLQEMRRNLRPDAELVIEPEIGTKKRKKKERWEYYLIH